MTTIIFLVLLFLTILLAQTMRPKPTFNGRPVYNGLPIIMDVDQEKKYWQREELKYNFRFPLYLAGFLSTFCLIISLLGSGSEEIIFLALLSGFLQTLLMRLHCFE
jgi:hypothetical protein